MPDRTAAQVEADGDATVTVDWGGVQVVVPATVDDLDLDALEAFESGHAAAFARQVLGPAAYAEARKAYETLHGRRPKVRDLKALLDGVARLYGFGGQGE